MRLVTFLRARSFVRREWRGHYKGQSDWFLLPSVGRDWRAFACARHPEFDAWRWSPLLVCPGCRDRVQDAAIYTQALNRIVLAILFLYLETRYHCVARAWAADGRELCEGTDSRAHVLVEDEQGHGVLADARARASGFVPDHAADARTTEAFMAGCRIRCHRRGPAPAGQAWPGGAARDAQPRRPHPGLLLTAQGAPGMPGARAEPGRRRLPHQAFALEELEARLTALVRRSPRPPASAPAVRLAVLRQRKPRRYTADGSLAVPLTPREHAALAALLTRSGYPMNEVASYSSRCSRHATAIPTPSRWCAPPAQRARRQRRASSPCAGWAMLESVASEAADS